jgi:hypothetical protein
MYSIQSCSKALSIENPAVRAAVLQIWDVFPGSGSENTELRKTLRVFNPKNYYSAQGNMIRNVLFLIRIFLFRIPGGKISTGSRIRNTDVQERYLEATQLLLILGNVKYEAKMSVVATGRR